MTIHYNIPDVNISQIRVIRHAEWIFQGKGPKEYRDRVMLENLIRLVVHASNEYPRGAAAFAVFIQNYGQKKKTIFRHWNMKKTALPDSDDAKFRNDAGSFIKF